jgi:D-3-phosphoglycerate dehydrogenase / 2-oxoglutarate reductase
VYRFRDLVWGLIGFGRIAQNMARKLLAFGFEIVAYDPYVSASYMKTCGVRKVALDEVLARAQLVCVMCPYTAETHQLLNAAAFARMRPGAMLVNTTRGKIVDNHALHEALAAGHLAAAALDDTEEEPAKLERWSPATNPLFSHPNCFVTPHVAYVSVEALTECRRVAAENARAVLLGEPPPNPVPP